MIAVLGLVLTGLPYMYGVAHLGVARRARRDARRRSPCCPALLVLPRAEGRPAAAPVPRPRRCKPEGNGESPAARWSHAVQRRPWPAAIAATALLLALAAPALGMRLGFPDAGNDPPDTMTRQAYDLNTEGFGPGTNGPLVIAAELPDRRRRGRDRLARASGCAASRRRVRPRPGDQRGGRRGDRHRDPDDARPRTRRPRTWSTGCATTSCPTRSAAPASPPRSAA